MERADVNIKIYCLKDPNTNIIRYVGITSKTLKYRLSKHIDNAKYTKHNKHLCNWILKFLKSGSKPIIELIEEVNIENWQEKERYYISLYPNLLNSSLGGEGVFGFKHSKETKEKLRIKATGKTYSEETLLKRSRALKGRILTQEHKDKIGAKNLNKIYTNYKIKVTNVTTKETFICNSVREVAFKFKMGEMTVRRNLNNEKVVKKLYVLTKI